MSTHVIAAGVIPLFSSLPAFSIGTKCVDIAKGTMSYLKLLDRLKLKGKKDMTVVEYFDECVSRR